MSGGPAAGGASRAVVLDVGGVLEVVDDAVFPRPFEERHGLPAGAVEAAARTLPGDPMVGEVDEAGVRAHWRAALGLDAAGTEELLADFWRWYAGTRDEELFAWFSGLRARGIATGILSNSAPGAREAERHHGFEAVVDVLVYSHEVGLAKPDPAVLDLTARRLGLPPAACVLVDDVPGHVAAARGCGWRAVLHTSTPATVAEVEALLAGAE